MNTKNCTDPFEPPECNRAALFVVCVRLLKVRKIKVSLNARLELSLKFRASLLRTLTKVLVELMIRGAQRGRVIRKESVRGNLKREGETGAQRRLPRPLVVPSHICAPRPVKINDRTQDKERMTKTIRIKAQPKLL